MREGDNIEDTYSIWRYISTMGERLHKYSYQIELKIQGNKIVKIELIFLKA